MTIDDAKQRVRAQYGSVGDAYVKSTGHATGSDLQRMIEVGQPKSTDILLDIATGGGHVARVFAPHVQKVIASDLTPEILGFAANYLQEQGLTNIEMLTADAEDIPLPDESVDIVTCRIAPHHFPHPDRFVNEVARVLRAGGRFLLVDSTVEAGSAGAFFNAFEKLRDPSHVRSLTIGEWLDLIAQSGLTVGLTESFSKRHDFKDWTSPSRVRGDDLARLEQMMLDAAPEMQQAHNAEFVDGRLVSFTDTKTLFVATR
jgi:ubiquinone/menaquinone biosynthesis C-methylase UbiE